MQTNIVPGELLQNTVVPEGDSGSRVQPPKLTPSLTILPIESSPPRHTYGAYKGVLSTPKS